MSAYNPYEFDSQYANYVPPPPTATEIAIRKQQYEDRRVKRQKIIDDCKKRGIIVHNAGGCFCMSTHLRDMKTGQEYIIDNSAENPVLQRGSHQSLFSGGKYS